MSRIFMLDFCALDKISAEDDESVKICIVAKFTISAKMIGKFITAIMPPPPPTI